MTGTSAGCWAWKALICAIRSVTLVAYLWVAHLLAYHRQSDPSSMPLLFRLFSCWMLLEVFYFPYWIITCQRLSVRGPATHACTLQAERIAMIEKIIAATKVTAGAEGAQGYSTGEWFLRWFRPTHRSSPAFTVEDILRDNLEEWIAWAAFDKTLECVNGCKVLAADCAQLADLVEKILGHKFLPGHNAEITSIRLTLDPIYATHRPIVYYAAIEVLHALGAIGVSLLGYRRREINGQTFLYRGPLDASLSAKMAPIVFCHGLGIGFLHYLRVLKDLPSSVYLIESPNITMTLGAETQRSIAETQALVSAMLKADGHSSACIVAHSFGTIIPSWLLNSKDAAVRALVQSVVLIDPISLLLFDPSVAFNFVHRRPVNSVEMMMSYFVSQEMYIAHTLARRFSWSNAVLFLDDIPSHVRVEVLLSGADAIVPARLVRAYVEQHRAQATAKRGGAGVEHPVWFDKVAHGELMLKEEYVTAIMRACEKGVQIPAHISSTTDPASCVSPATATSMN